MSGTPQEEQSPDYSDVPGADEFLAPSRRVQEPRPGATPVEEVYRRLTELTKTKGYLSVEEARDLLRTLEAGIPDQVIGSYRLLELLGEGATANVYRAVHLDTRRIIALKVLEKEVLNDPEIYEHFLREAKVVMLLRHPNIVRGLEIGDTEDYCYIALEFVDGRTLRDLALKLGSLGELESLHILRQITYALEYTHRCELVHTDIKPENILIDDNTLETKLFDLGMLRDRTAPEICFIGSAPVNPRYASPEILAGLGNVDVRSDIYSLGQCLFFMLTGGPAFLSRRNPQEVDLDRRDLERRLRAVKPHLSERTIYGVLRMLEYHRDRRPRDPVEVLDIFGEHRVDPFRHALKDG